MVNKEPAGRVHIMRFRQLHQLDAAFEGCTGRNVQHDSNTVHTGLATANRRG